MRVSGFEGQQRCLSLVGMLWREDPTPSVSRWHDKQCRDPRESVAR